MRLTSSLRTSLLASFLLALGGCVATVDIDSPDPTPATPTPAPTTMTPPATPPAKSPSCGIGDASDPTGVVLAWARGADLVFTRADGSSFVAHAFPVVPSADPGATPTVHLAARGGFVAAIARSYAGGTLVSEALLLDRTGTVLWSETRSDAAFSVLYLGDEGALALGLSGDQDSTIVVSPAGKIGEFMYELPLSAPTKGGRVAVQHDFSVYASPTYRWLDPASGTMGSFAYATDHSYPMAVEGGVAYVTPDLAHGGSTFVSEGDNVTAFELEAEYASLGTPARHGFTVIHTQWGAPGPGSPMWRAQPGAQPAPITLPELTVLRVFGREGLRVGDLGELLAPMRDEHLGGLYRSLDLGATWHLVSPSFTGITDAPFVQRGGTYVIQATDEPGYFTMDPWAPPAGGAAPDRTGAANELVRPADGIVRELPATAQSFVLSEEGGCLAYQDGGHLFAGEVSSGKTVDLGEMAGPWDSLDSAVVWVP